MSTETGTRETAGSHHEPQARFDLLSPTDGPVAAGLWLVLFYFVVDRLSGPAVVAIQRWEPAVAADSVTTWLAVLLWLVVGAVVVKQLVRQVTANPRSFDSPTERLAFLDRDRPTQTAYVFYTATVLVGLVVAAAVWPAVGTLLDRLFAMVLERQDGATFDVQSAALLGAFFVGFAVAARAADRLVVGGCRDLLYRSLQPTDVAASATARADAMRLAGWAAIAVAVVLVGYWLVLLGSGQVPAVQDEPLPLTPRLVGQVGTGIALLVAGTALVTERSYAIRAFLVAAGLLAYAFVDAVGYFVQQGDTVGVGLFVALTVVAVGVARPVIARSWFDARRTEQVSTAEGPTVEEFSDDD
ncbi:hypothetical protein [Haloarchaeobius sp. HME9146]|uniref:hypothetical protein n=1 Tax=Haloarchaeobius sp. HME9146 TaxID=2978732 RepID=UPI0021BFDAD2|nr:hypothetical protein [Haloarchaeobius sp. HME9146]MCT9096445.1 hypothetical protein [Haloarchaeobius sp. HME9146]